MTQRRETDRLSYIIVLLSQSIFRDSGVKNWNPENTNSNL